jgi:uncharacterized protein (DUF488 family)
MNKLYTIGHSNHEIDHFLHLLKRHAISAIADVRSSPYSKFNPQFNREIFQTVLKENRIAYVFLGAELGPRSENPVCYLNGKVQYGRLAGTDLFLHGVERLLAGMKNYRIALMCAEKDPISCHRMILVCRALRSEPIEIIHILEDGSVESLGDSERRLMQELKMRQLRMFESPEDLIQRAYGTQGEKIAYVRDDPGAGEADEQTGDASWQE